MYAEKKENIILVRKSQGPRDEKNHYTMSLTFTLFGGLGSTYKPIIFSWNFKLKALSCAGLWACSFPVVELSHDYHVLKVLKKTTPHFEDSFH